MIQISESAQAHFRKLIDREGLPGLGVRLSAHMPGTAQADVRLEFAEPADLGGDEWAVDCEGFTLWVDAASVRFLDGAGNPSSQALEATLTLAPGYSVPTTWVPMIRR